MLYLRLKLFIFDLICGRVNSDFFKDQQNTEYAKYALYNKTCTYLHKLQEQKSEVQDFCLILLKY